jgi:hypothetical protein
VVAGVLLAVSRAIGETMIVVMAASGAANITLNPFESATTVTKQIVDLLTGESRVRQPQDARGVRAGPDPVRDHAAAQHRRAARGEEGIAKPMSKPVAPERAPTDWGSAGDAERIRRRYAAERRFQLFGLRR